MIRETIDGVRIVRFDGPVEFGAVVDAETGAAHGPERDRRQEDSGWVGGTWAQAVTATRGDLSHVPDAERMIDAIALQVETGLSTWAPGVAGAFPCVPDFLSGRPDCMRRRVDARSDRAPVRLYLASFGTQDIDAATLAKRGIAFLALAMAFARVRPTEVYAVLPNRVTDHRGAHDGILTVRIPSAPLDLAAACGMLCRPEVWRGLGFAYIRHIAGAEPGANIPHFKGISPSPGEGRERHDRAVRETLALTDRDLYFGPAYSADEPLTKDPVRFVQEQIARMAQESI